MKDLYINKHSLMGMLSRNQTILEDYSILRNRNKIVCFDEESVKSHIGKYENINLAYFLEKLKDPMLDFYARSTAVIVGPLNKENFLQFKGKNFQEYRETLNALDKKLYIKTEMINPNDVKELVDIWDNVRGREKYGFQRHSGYDKNFFTSKYFPEEKDKLQILFFYDKETDKCVGYSVLSLESSNSLEGTPLFSYLIRKYIPAKEYKNLCLYIDLKTFQQLVSSREQSCLVHFGASSGGVLNYKLNKFKHFLYKKYDVFFGKVKNQTKDKV